MPCPEPPGEPMRRRSSTGGEPIKARRRKTATLKRRTAPKTVRRRNSSDATHETEIGAGSIADVTKN